MASIRTSDGRLVDPFNPKPEDVRPKVIIHALSQINRFTGQAAWPYPVAQHEVNLYRWINNTERNLARRMLMGRTALVHDMAESWFNDLASPVKKECPEYKRAEHQAMLFIANELDVTERMLEEFDQYDKRIYKDERDALFPIIEEQGMGDDYEKLGCPEWYFRETDWRSNRAQLSSLFIAEFGREVFER
jgi:hypothetical protein